MPVRVACPECESEFNASNASAGKKIKCPKCQASILAPVVSDEEDFEVVEDPVPTAKVKSKAGKAEKKPVIVEDEEDEEHDRPRKKSKVVAKDEEDDDEEEQPRKKKSKKKKSKSKKQSSSPAKLIGTALALILAVGAIAFAVIRHTSRSNDTATKPTQDSDPTPTPTPNPNQPKIVGQPVTPKPQPPIPKPSVPKTGEPREEPIPIWEVWNPPKSQFGMRLPPGSAVDYQDVQTDVVDGVIGLGRVTDYRVGAFQHKGRGFLVELHVLFLKPGLSAAQREEVMLAQAKHVRLLMSKSKLLSEFETTLGGQAAKGETYEVEDYFGFRRYTHTETAVYYVNAVGVARLSKHWLKDVTTSVESLQYSPITTTFTPTQSANPFASGSISWLALPHSGTQIAAFGVVPVNPKDRSKGDKSQVQLWDRNKATTEVPARQLVSPKLEFFTGPIAFSPDDKLLAVLSGKTVVFFEYSGP